MPQAFLISSAAGGSFYADSVLEKVFEREIDADIIYGHWMLVFENGKTQLGRAPQAADMAYFYDGNMCHQSMLIKTEMVKSRPYDEMSCFLLIMRMNWNGLTIY